MRRPPAALVFVAGAALLVPFDHPATIAAGVLLLLASIVLGVFGVASPSYLAVDPRDPTARREYLGAMRMIDCDCGRTLQAANDEDMLRVVRGHLDEEHPNMTLSDGQIRALVAERAYSATDS